MVIQPRGGILQMRRWEPQGSCSSGWNQILSREKRGESPAHGVLNKPLAPFCVCGHTFFPPLRTGHCGCVRLPPAVITAAVHEGCRRLSDAIDFISFRRLPRSGIAKSIFFLLLA